LIYCESRWQYQAINDNGVFGKDEGIAQLNSQCLGYYSYKYNGGEPINPYSARVSIKIACRILNDLWHRYGTWKKAVIAWNAGRVEGAPQASVRFAEEVVE
jgi:soluble lytic murein transglycosylase-like protein